MNTPICDFVKAYNDKSAVRMHMPGHKGKNILGLEKYDITEIDGADNLYISDGIIKLSEENASDIFGCETFYSTEGSSLCIRAMLFLAVKYAKEKGVKPVIAAGRNAHKTFLSAAAMLDFDVIWLSPKNSENYLSLNIDAKYLDETLSSAKIKPIAVYVTTPDYLGKTLNLTELKAVCVKHGALLLVDNAHGAYLNFLSAEYSPAIAKADAYCDSAHKTLSVLTGGAYLHISKSAPNSFLSGAKYALSFFGSTSPSYLILQSLDAANLTLSDDFAKKLRETIVKIDDLKKALTENGYELYGNEPLKITIKSKSYGYTGKEINDLLKSKKIFVEFYDEDYVVLMPSTATEEKDFYYLKQIFLSIPRRTPIKNAPPTIKQLPKKVIGIREASLSPAVETNIENACGKILAETSISCPPAVPIIVSGEMIDENVIELFKYYGVKRCSIIKN